MKRRKAKADRREEILRVRATTEQKNVIEAAAKASGIGVSSWLLQLGLREAKSALA